jgi:NADH dehydrogenase (ubiquinone) 1 alpha subcomplex subunit 6
VVQKRATAHGTTSKMLTITVQAPEIQTMYSLNMPVSTLRTKMRQEFERHRYVNQLKTVDVLLFNSHQEFQVRLQPDTMMRKFGGIYANMEKETLNFWKQLSHVLKYFRAEEDPKARLPNNFINGFLEARTSFSAL